MAAHFTHLLTGKRVIVVDPRSVAAFFTGPVQGKDGKPSPTDNVWLVIDKVPSPIPVVETEDEVLTKLGLKE